jgi:large subunit ribosomal protein L13
MNAKTYSQKTAEISREWILIDASSANLGIIASLAAKYLIGKHKPTYTPHVDSGDYVVIINSKLLKVTGSKETEKMYHHYSGFPGGLKSTSLGGMRDKNPNAIIELAVQGMLPVNKLRDGRMKRLKVFVDDNHSHTAQTPKKVEVK